MRKLAIILSLLCVGLVSTNVEAQTKARTLIGDVKVGSVSADPQVDLRALLWGGEAATFYANGGVTTTPNSIYGKMGLNFKITNGDDSVQQARDYIAGKTPIARMTFRMACLFAEEFNKDPRTRPVMVLQLTYSLGDHMVGRKDIKTLNDLKTMIENGQKPKVCLQEAGPHLGLVEDSFKAVGISWSDCDIVWAKNLTGDNSPPEMFRNDPSIHIACVITPDMIGLCSGIDQEGSGAEGTVEGSHVVNSTSSMSRSIADVYICRSDYFEANRDKVENFVAGYLQASEAIVKGRKAYDAGEKAPEYSKVMDQMQKFYGEDALPTVEEDVHGLILDANFVRVPGNEIFFTDKNNLAGYFTKQTSGLEMAKNLGYVSQGLGFLTADWDYKKMSQKAGVKYIAPVYSTNKIKGEVTDFVLDLDSDTVFTFDIYFDPNETTFPIEKYAPDFKRFFESSATFGNAAYIIEGNGDPTLALKHFLWAAKAKGLIAGSKGSYTFNGQAMSLADTNTVIRSIESNNLSGMTRTNKQGQNVEIPDPRETVAAAVTTSQNRAENAKTAMKKFGQDNKYQFNWDGVFPRGVGISNPVNPRPRNMAEAKKNMRVTIRVVKVQAEALSQDDFDFED